MSDQDAGADPRLDFHPGMGMRWEITRSTEETSGELFEATNWIDRAMPGPPVHVHPTAEESYEVVEGAIEVFMDGKWSSVRAGEKAIVPAGAPHSIRNAADEPARIVNVHRPALRFEAFFRDMHRLTHEGRSSACRQRNRAPRSTRRCCSASTRTRSASRSRRTGSSGPWRSLAGRFASTSAPDRAASDPPTGAEAIRRRFSQPRDRRRSPA